MNELLQVSELLKEIEKLREEIKSLYNNGKLDNPELVRKSQELDEVLNKYNKVIGND